LLLQVGGLALATSIAAVFNMLLLGYLLRRRLDGFGIKGLLGAFARVCVVGAVMGGLLWMLEGWVQDKFGFKGLGGLAGMVLVFFVGVGVFIGLSQILCREEMGALQELLKRKN